MTAAAAAAATTTFADSVAVAPVLVLAMLFMLLVTVLVRIFFALLNTCISAAMLLRTSFLPAGHKTHENPCLVVISLNIK